MSQLFEKNKPSSAAKPPARPVYNIAAEKNSSGRKAPPPRMVYDYKKVQEKAKQHTQTPVSSRPPAPRQAAERPTRPRPQTGYGEENLPPLRRQNPNTPPLRKAGAPPPNPAKKTLPRKRKKKKALAQQTPPRQISYWDARKQRRRRSIFTAIGVGASLLLGLFLSVTVLFKIETIAVEINGESTYTQQQVVQALGVAVGDNLFGFQDEKTADALQQNLPYLENVTIKRKLPGGVEVLAQPAVECYALNSDSGWVVLSETFKVLRISAEIPQGLTLVLGAQALAPVAGQAMDLGDAERLQALQSLTQQLSAQAFLPVSEIDLTDTLELSFLYDGRIRVLLGTSNELAEKIEWAKYLVTPENPQSLGETERGTLDVSSRNENGRMEGIWRVGKL